MTRAASQSSEAGFSLIEVMIAMLLLVIGMTGILGLFTTAMRLEKSAEERTDVATALPEAMLRIEAEAGGAVAAPRQGGRRKAGSGEFPIGPGGRYRCRYLLESLPGADDARGLVARVKLVASPGTNAETEYDFGYLPIVPTAPSADRRK